jgi:hypothetical protein
LPQRSEGKYVGCMRELGAQAGEALNGTEGAQAGMADLRAPR